MSNSGARSNIYSGIAVALGPPTTITEFGSAFLAILMVLIVSSVFSLNKFVIPIISALESQISFSKVF
jgi:hypothetical protein